MIPDEQERADPQQRATVGESRERGKLELRGARDNGGKVAHTRHEIADRERPMSDAVKPVMHPADLVLTNVQEAASARMQEFPSDRSSNEKAAGDAAHAACERA